MAEEDKRAIFEEQAMPYLDMLYGTALRLTHVPADAEDLVQDTYLKAFRAYDQYEQGTNFKAWIFKILTNNFFNKYKKEKRSPDPVSIDDTPDFYLYEKVTDTMGGGGESPEKEFLNKFIPENIKSAVQSLPEEYKIAFILSDVNEFTYEEIAQVTETNIGTVKSRLFRARRMLQHLLWEYAKEQGIVHGEPSRV
ncbi:MAG: sigma-70 family RNA polymerase sigma factor [bacterium]